MATKQQQLTISISTINDTNYIENVRAFRSILERIRCSKSAKLFGRLK
jgi:hypothetical protein